MHTYTPPDRDMNTTTPREKSPTRNVTMTRNGSIHLACWNMNGLSDYKQQPLLDVAVSQCIDILAISETHLVNQEQQNQWQRVVDKHGAYVWFGRPAKYLHRHDAPLNVRRGRGSGGVGLLMRKNWVNQASIIQPLPQHDCLLWVKVDLSDCPFPLFVCTAYMAPVGSARAEQNESLLEELEMAITMHKADGCICVMGDFNIHIGQLPSIMNYSGAGVMGMDGPVHVHPSECMRICIDSSIIDNPVNAYAGLNVRVLQRRSVDWSNDRPLHALPARSHSFVSRMNTVGMMIVNGLSDVGDGEYAEATCGRDDPCTSVIDFVMIHEKFIQNMSSVRVVTESELQLHPLQGTIQTVPYSDHRLVKSCLSYERRVRKKKKGQSDHDHEEENIDINQHPVISDIIYQQRFDVDKKGEVDHFDLFKSLCERKMKGLVKDFKRRLLGHSEINIEEMWRSFKLKLHEAAEMGLSEKTNPSNKDHHHVHTKRRKNAKELMFVDPALLRLESEHKCIMKQLQNVLRVPNRNMHMHLHMDADHDHVDVDVSVNVDELRRSAKSARNRVKKRRRKLLRTAEVREIEHIESLRPNQARRFWQKLKQLGCVSGGGKQIAVPSCAVDKAGQVYDDEEAVRRVWCKAWATLATYDAEDGRFDQQFHDRLIHQLQQQTREEAMKDIDSDENAENEDDDQKENANASISISMSPEPVRIPPPSSSSTVYVGTSELNLPITLSEVCLSVGRLQNHKAAGADGIVGEMLKQGGDSLLACVHLLCVAMFKTGNIPMDWLRGVIVPLHKDGDKRDPLNYRPITLLSIAGKVYAGVLHARLIKWSESNNIIVPEQGGFRPQRGCAEQIFTLTELIRIRRARKQSTFACFIDIRKAYDTVWHDGLKVKLREYGIHGGMYNAIVSMYAACESTVRLGEELGFTEFFNIDTGVRQGCILSPWLYALYINDLAKEIKQSGLGAFIDEKKQFRLSLLLYADDIVLLGNNKEDLQTLLHICASYACRWRFEYNHAKCALLHFSCNSSPLPTSVLLLGTTPVQWVSCYRYLGVELHSSGNLFRSFHPRLIDSATRCMHAVSGMGLFSGKVSVVTACLLYHSLVRSVLEYGGEVASVQRAWPEAEKLQNRMARVILQAPVRVATVAMMAELGWSSMEGRMQQLRLSLYGRIMKIKARVQADAVAAGKRVDDYDHPVVRVFDASVAWLNSSFMIDETVGCYSNSSTSNFDVVRPSTPCVHSNQVPWAAQVRCDLLSLGLEQYWRPDGAGVYMFDDSQMAAPAAHWRGVTKRAVQQRESRRMWERCKSYASLTTFTSVTMEEQVTVGHIQHYLTVRTAGWNDRTHRGRLWMTALRCGYSTLQLHSGRVRGVPVEKRLCQLGCVGAVEDEKHFLLICPMFESRRKKLKNDINMLVRLQDRKNSNVLVHAHAHVSDNKRRIEDHQQVEIQESHVRMNCDVQHEQCAEMAMSDMESDGELSDSDSEWVSDQRCEIQPSGEAQADALNTTSDIKCSENEFDCNQLPATELIRILLGGEHNRIQNKKIKLKIERMIMVELSEWMDMKHVEEEKRQLMEYTISPAENHSQSQ